MNTEQIEQKIKEANPGKFHIETGLYLRVLSAGSGHFVARYSYMKKRKEITLGKYSNKGDALTLEEARQAHLKVKIQLKKGLDPLYEKKHRQYRKHSNTQTRGALPLNTKQIEKKIKEGNPGRFRIEVGLYLRVLSPGSGHFVARYTYMKKRKEITLGKYSNKGDALTLAEAKQAHLKVKIQLKEGLDPKHQKKLTQVASFTLVNDIAEDWLKESEKRLEHPHVPRRQYASNIAPILGDLSITKVTPPYVLFLLRDIRKSGRPTISNDVLSLLKRIFNHAIKLGLINVNPAAAFTMQDAGGTENSRTRMLTLEEIRIVFEVMRENKDRFTFDNYIAFTLLLCLGVRKTELTAARWEEFNFEEKIWNLSVKRTKTKAPIKIPISDHLMPIFEILKMRACGSEYIFPARRKGKRRGYISDDTLNHAIGKLFGMQQKKKNKSKNLFGERGIAHFTVHDLRRTFRSLLAENGTPCDIAERCLNHKLKGVIGIYNRYDYFDERKEAMDIVAGQILQASGPLDYELQLYFGCRKDGLTD